jgi:hypothetical protein
MTWKTPGTFGVQNRILLDSGTELFKTHKTGISRENRDKWEY